MFSVPFMVFVIFVDNENVYMKTGAKILLRGLSRPGEGSPRPGEGFPKPEKGSPKPEKGSLRPENPPNIHLFIKSIKHYFAVTYGGKKKQKP